jgi:hypothetical protein
MMLAGVCTHVYLSYGKICWDFVNERFTRIHSDDYYSDNTLLKFDAHYYSFINTKMLTYFFGVTL